MKLHWHCDPYRIHTHTQSKAFVHTHDSFRIMTVFTYLHWCTLQTIQAFITLRVVQTLCTNQRNLRSSRFSQNFNESFQKDYLTFPSSYLNFTLEQSLSFVTLVLSNTTFHKNLACNFHIMSWIMLSNASESPSERLRWNRPGCVYLHPPAWQWYRQAAPELGRGGRMSH